MMSRAGIGRPKPLIQDIFKRGQEVLVQVIKEGIGTKGPTLSTYISIAGRYLVLMPGLNRVGVSRKIEDDEARRRLREIFNELKPPKGLGFIIRTAGIDRNKKELQRDLAYLSRLWQVVVRRITQDQGAGRDLPGKRHDHADHPRHLHQRHRHHLGRRAERLRARPGVPADRDAALRQPHQVLRRHRAAVPQVRHRGRDRPHPAAARCRCPHGGSIVIEQTEALVAIDVNSGNFRADNNAEETAYQMNLQAAKEIARQLRLRDLGGVIVNDFIDMRDEKHRRGVEKALRDAVKRDRAGRRSCKISQFGIIEMTRQRIRPSLKRSVYQDCPHCRGTGHVKTAESMSIEVMRLLQLAAHRQQIERIVVRVQDEVARYLLNRKRKEISKLEEAGSAEVTVHSVPEVSPEFLELTCFDSNGNEVKFTPYEEAPRPQPRRR